MKNQGLDLNQKEFGLSFAASPVPQPCDSKLIHTQMPWQSPLGHYFPLSTNFLHALITTPHQVKKGKFHSHSGFP